MHDQYPPEIVEQRRKLVPILIKANKDNKTAYIRYNKLIIDGREYTDGVYGKVPQQEAVEGNLKILTWNCNGLTKEKRENDDFTNFLTKYDLLILLESWTSKCSKIELNGYVKHNFYRKFKHRNARRNSGGIVIYYKDYLSPGIQIIKTHHDTIIWLKLDHNFFSLTSDIYLCGAYIWGVDSPAYNVVNCNLFDLLESDINYFNQFGTVLVAGDLNGRVGKNNDFVINDFNNSVFDDEDYIPDVPIPRSTLDNTTNSQGHQILDLCKSTELRICNGRLDKTGNYTYCSTIGSSVIDYLLINYNDFSCIDQFKVLEFNEFSDHAPLYFSLCAFVGDGVYDNSLNDEKIKICWDESKRDNYRRVLITKLPEFNTIFQNVDVREKESINDAVCNFINIISNVTTPLFQKHIKPQKTSRFEGNTGCNNANWFDNICAMKKTIYKYALITFNQSKTSEIGNCR